MFRNRARAAGFLAAAAVVGSLTGMPTAQADERPSDQELLEKCGNGTKTCVFHPGGQPDEFTGKRHQVGDFAYNCTSRKQRSSLSWSDTTGETNSVGLSMSATFGIIFKTTVTTSFEHAWMSSHTETQTTNVDVRPGEVGWITRAPRMQSVEGTYELVFKKRYKGHYYWYVPFTATGPTGVSNKSQLTRPMTAKEKARYCDG
ncbi:hypothetical protein [Streptomyces cucumeris]|uniref:hypothetical protein n=1 Tax=Streptomyces cucumeris TaxID=2962890 RepID=UPI0020C8821F|nr:hypothetical protein [Streptomyces sp. NEAU-Y11]MCP9210786.1 hypothetical protein [Streptomyces sp. NEAU-Y11]